MSKKLWLGLVLILILSWIGLRPYLTSAPAKTSAADIAALTDVRTVARWVLQHQQLPDYYITKSRPAVWAGILRRAICVTCCQAGRLAAIAFPTAKESYLNVQIGSGMRRM